MAKTKRTAGRLDRERSDLSACKRINSCVKAMDMSSSQIACYVVRIIMCLCEAQTWCAVHSAHFQLLVNLRNDDVLNEKSSNFVVVEAFWHFYYNINTV